MSGLSVAQASDILTQAWRAVWGRSPTQRELTYSLAIAWLETGFGRAGQFGTLAAQGQYNWGALERVPGPGGVCPPGTAGGQDAGNSRCFYVYGSDVAAATAFIHTLTKTHWPGVVPAMNSGSPTDVANAMGQPPAYFEAPAATYAAGIANAAKHIGVSIPSPSGSAVPWLLVAGAGIAAFAWYSDSFGAPSWTPRLIRRFL